ncbi:MAG TPA: S49 family peptidase [Gammaproteobacteria bacterium]|nr:S49 family peptidase [Gammaproteobacteria bacterium]
MKEINTNDPASILARELLSEKRADRRWKNVRFIFWFALFAYIIYHIFHFSDKPLPHHEKGKHVALVRLDGMIAPDRDLSAEALLPILEDAFEDKAAKGVIIDINSPGGTPVQAAIIHDAIMSYKKKYHKKVIIVGEDLLTSGAYYVAVAGDKIFVNPSTITGSIGVIMKGFGFVDLMKKVGIERRVYTVGADKDRLDPFLPQQPEDLKKIQQVMNEVHQHFIQAVLIGRKGKLKGDPTKLFTGDFWSGDTALRLGLVDGLGNLIDVSQAEFGTSEFKEYNGMPNIFKLLSGEINSTFDNIFYSAV